MERTSNKHGMTIGTCVMRMDMEMVIDWVPVSQGSQQDLVAMEYVNAREKQLNILRPNTLIQLFNTLIKFSLRISFTSI